MSEKITGAEALLRSIEAEGADTIFGYPGGAIIPVFDRLYDHKDKLRHILVRHEQGATHAAQGYARVSGKTGVVFVTSGPGATNVITGLSDAMMDSTPLVVITGQVSSESLGSDAFQETDVIGITQPVTKWSHQIRTADEIAWAVSRAFYIASTGRPGPVVLDFAKNAQNDQNKVLKDLVALTKARMGDKPLDFRVSIAEDIPETLHGDHSNLKKIIIIKIL